MVAEDHPRNGIDETQYCTRIECRSMLPELDSLQQIMGIFICIPGQGWAEASAADLDKEGYG